MPKISFFLWQFKRCQVLQKKRKGLSLLITQVLTQMYVSQKALPCHKSDSHNIKWNFTFSTTIKILNVINNLHKKCIQAHPIWTKQMIRYHWLFQLHTLNKFLYMHPIINKHKHPPCCYYYTYCQMWLRVVKIYKTEW